ncbi:DUF6646 family protein [Pseudotamlana agarivorans]|uniref:DUF6646 family protein n=1 Tax=Pseudotamlana agarivorans TaxID=481183 RepID=UPI0008367891|nr:DUF6646 family protein [Tamlana agarivorans]
MKNILVIAALLAVSFVNAQAFSGQGDQKFQVGVNLQSHATGINVSYDYGLGENISIGLSSSYALGISDELEIVDDPAFKDRFDVKARFNANIGNVINIDDNFDLYPGLSLSLKNFGGHVGARYFFTSGFGIFTEARFPIAKYNNDLTPAEELYNQFSMNIGVSFNI